MYFKLRERSQGEKMPPKQKIPALIPCFGTRAGHASWCHPNSASGDALLCLAEGRLPALSARGGRYTPAPQMSFPASVGGGFQPETSFSARGTAVTASASQPVNLSAYLERVRLGRIISRQSRSPRCRPRISISAVARLVAMGMLWVSQRWMVCISA